MGLPEGSYAKCLPKSAAHEQAKCTDRANVPPVRASTTANMNAFLLSAALSFAQSPAPQSRIVGASLFKNGFAVVVRETEIKNGQALIETLPQASLGTLWISSSPGVTISEATTMVVTTDGERDAGSIDEILSANIGKDVTLFLGSDGSATGKLVSATGTIVILQKGQETSVVQKANVRGVSAAMPLSYKLKTTSAKRVLRVKTTSAQTGKVFTLALERGMTWSPAYAIDISDPKKLAIIGKATILNDLGDLDNVEARLITGFPNLPYRDMLDPLTSGAALSQYTNQMMNLGTGGFGGGGGAPGAAMSQNMMRADARGAFDSFDVSTLPSQEGEDLFFYRRPKVSLKAGERGYYVLFKGESDYEHIYTWDIADSISADARYTGTPEGPGDVWHSLKFSNKTDLPWTTAVAVTQKDGEILGQDMLNYTARGAGALVKITKALDIRADSTEEEIARERFALRMPNSGVTYDLVTLKGTLEIKNRKAQDVKLQVSREITGELVESQFNPKITKTAKGLRQVNPRVKLDWDLSLGAGKAVTVTFSYKVFVMN